MKAIPAILLLLSFSPAAYGADCLAGPEQTPAARAVELTTADTLGPDEQAETLACLARAAQETNDTIEGLRNGDLTFRAIAYESGPEGEK